MQSKIRAKQHEELSHELFLTTRKKKNRNAFANNIIQ